MYTGETKDEKAAARAEEERLNINVDPRRGGQIRGESQSPWTEQERIDRADSQRSSIFSSPGTTVTGGMLDHLIDDYAGQVAVKEQEITRLNEDINRYRDEVGRLNFRIEELKALKEELYQQVKEHA